MANTNTGRYTNTGACLGGGGGAARVVGGVCWLFVCMAMRDREEGYEGLRAFWVGAGRTGCVGAVRDENTSLFRREGGHELGSGVRLVSYQKGQGKREGRVWCAKPYR